MEFPFSKGKRPNKTRSGAIPLNVETLAKVKRYEKGKMASQTFSTFVAEMMGKWAEDDRPDSGAAEEAIKTLGSKKNIRRHAGVAALGGVANPMIAAAARGTKGFVDTQGDLKARLGGAARGVGSASAGDVASQVVGGVLGGAVSSMGAEGIKIHQARKKLEDFMNRKHAADGMTGMGGTSGARVGGAPASTMGSLPSDAAAAPIGPRGSGNFTPKYPKQKALSIRGKSVNPRLRLSDAMNKGMA